MTSTPVVSIGKPAMSRVRWQVFAILLLLMAINYVDRAVLAIAMPAIQKDLGLDPAAVGVVLSAFFWGYATMQLPSGWLADRFKPEKLVIGAALAWGLVQTLTGFAASSRVLISLRVLLGVSEAPLYPAGAKLQSIWLSSKERGRGATLLDGGAPLGTAIGGPIIVAFMAWFGGWRGALVGAGVLTMIVGYLSWLVIRGGLEGNKRVNEAEREYIKTALTAEFESRGSERGANATAKDYASSRSVYGMCLGWASSAVIFYGLLTWGPSYLAKTQNIKIATIGYSTLIIFGSGFIGEMIAGWISDTWRKRGGSYNTVMHTIFVISGIMTTSAVILLRYTTSLFQAIGLLSIALFFVRWAGLYWSVPAAISQREHVGLVGSVMNICSNTMGILTPLAVGIIVSRTGSYDMALMMFAVSGGIFTLSSFMIDFTRKVGDPR